MNDFVTMAAAIALGLSVAVPVSIKVIQYQNRTRLRNTKHLTDDLVGRKHLGGNVATFNISGRTFRGQNIQITNDRIVIDGKDVTDEYDIKPVGILEIKITEGVVGNITTDANVSAGSVGGNIDAGGNVSCGSVGGSVDAGGNVSCGSVGGNIDAGGNVRHG